jgi:hypothetical protein
VDVRDEQNTCQRWGAHACIGTPNLACYRLCRRSSDVVGTTLARPSDMKVGKTVAVLSVSFALLMCSAHVLAHEGDAPPLDSPETPDNSFLECITYTNRSAEERESFCRVIYNEAYRRECWRHTNDSARGWLAFCAVFVTQ